MKNIFSILIVSFALAACSGDTDDAVKQTDSLLAVSSYNDSVISMYVSDTAHARYEEMKQAVNYIGENMLVLPENRKHRTAVSDYANVFKGFRRFFKTIEQVKKENAVNMLQLKAMQEDIRNGVMGDEERARYLAEEMKAVTETTEKMKEQVLKYGQLCSERDEFGPVVIAVVDSLKKTKKIP
jgi:hypothetical protein